MKYSITINPKSKKSSALIGACQFVESLISEGNKVSSIYFYGDSVKELQALNDNIKNALESLSDQCLLHYCSTIAEDLPKDKAIPEFFQSSSLAQWLNEIESSDRHLEFV